MLETGVRFAFVDRIVTNYHIYENAPTIRWRRERIQER